MKHNHIAPCTLDTSREERGLQPSRVVFAGSWLGERFPSNFIFSLQGCDLIFRSIHSR